MRPLPRALLGGLAAGALLLTTACSGLPQDQQAAVDRATRIVDQVKDAVDQARERARASVGETRSTPAPQGRVLRTDTHTAFDYDVYSQTLATVLESLETYWAQQVPRLGGTYSSPQRYVYYRPEQSPGPSCGGERAPAKNAFYCPAGDFIAWDETGLMIPYYVSGDFAAAFVLAHEFGHAMQARLPRKESLGIVRELQADCFAGAWARSAQDGGFLDPGDLDEATIAVLSARDVPGTAFTDPQAHGTGFERTRAFTDGYEGGPPACYPAPAQDWLVGRTSAGTSQGSVVSAG